MNLTTNLLALPALYNTKSTGFSICTSTSISNLTTNITNTTSPSAPLYHNVSAGVAWVLPASTHDLGARGMSCECFDPELKCCMPASSSNAPFCIAQNATCCADTYCTAEETCCGDACCASGLTCTTPTPSSYSSPSCCPLGAHCTGPPHCLDASSPNCTNPFATSAQCCPPLLPYCRIFAPYGLACYASSSSSPSSSSATPIPSSGPDEGHRTLAPSNTSYASTTTETVSVVPIPGTGAGGGGGAYSLAFPSATVAAATGGVEGAVSTSVVLAFSSSSFASDRTSTASNATSAHSATATSRTSTTSESHPLTSASSSKSTLCFNDDVQAPGACSSSSATTADDGGFPGASTVRSGAGRRGRGEVVVVGAVGVGIVVGIVG